MSCGGEIIMTPPRLDPKPQKPKIKWNVVIGYILFILCIIIAIKMAIGAKASFYYNYGSLAMIGLNLMVMI